MKIKFRNIKFGKDFVLLLTNNDYLYSFGNNKFGSIVILKIENFQHQLNFFVENRKKYNKFQL